MTQNHPRGGSLPKPENFDQINLDRSQQIYKERFANAADFTFLFVGAVNEATLKPLLEKYIGSLPAQAKKENFKDLGIRPPYRMVDTVFTKGTEPQSQVNIVFTTPAVFNPAEQYALVSLGELLSIKLVEKLREEKGGVLRSGCLWQHGQIALSQCFIYYFFPLCSGKCGFAYPGGP